MRVLPLVFISCNMNLNQYQRLNVNHVPLLHKDQPPEEWPLAFILVSDTHAIYVEKKGDTVIIYDPYGGIDSKEFDGTLQGLHRCYHFFLRNLQYDEDRHLALLHCFLFSMHLFSLAPEAWIKGILPSRLMGCKRRGHAHLKDVVLDLCLQPISDLACSKYGMHGSWAKCRKEPCLQHVA